jgi:HEAT repeat protein
VRTILDRLQPSGYDAADHARTLITLEEQVTAAAVQAVRTSPEGARLVADALLSRGHASALAPFTDGLEGLDPEARKAAEAVALRVSAKVEPAFVALVRHPSADLRVRAIRVLARQATPQAQAAVIDALQDEDEGVQRAALAVLGERGSSEGVDALSKTLADSPTWSLRLRAARALGQLEPGQASTGAVQALSRAARQDPYALVREAAITAIARVASSQARPVLVEAAAKDEEPAVRDLAARLLQGG